MAKGIEGRPSSSSSEGISRVERARSPIGRRVVGWRRLLFTDVMERRGALVLDAELERERDATCISRRAAFPRCLDDDRCEYVPDACLSGLCFTLSALFPLLVDDDDGVIRSALSEDGLLLS